ncbi:hypothetical protein [Actinacidiphila sp. bgisy167]|uniref:hypothetical protein n=1 Tax=Actinacidiphila sp. bgisy167 TaxID=3413797 RepID=UPI003D723583
MKRARLAALVTGLTAATTLTACGVPPSGVIEAGEAARGVPPRSRTAELGTVYLYFLRDGRLIAHARDTTEPGNLEGAVDMLFGGPNHDETAKKVTTELPVVTYGPKVSTESDGTVLVLLPEGVTPLTDPAMLQLACTVSAVGSSLAARSSGGGGAEVKPKPPAGKGGFLTYSGVKVIGDGWTRTRTADSCPDA